MTGANVTNHGFKPNDVVRLRSGSPDFVVMAVEGDKLHLVRWHEAVPGCQSIEYQKPTFCTYQPQPAAWFVKAGKGK